MGLLETLTQNFRRIRVTNATDNGFPSRVMTATEPVGLGDSAAQATASAVFDIAGSKVTQANRAILKFFGAGSNNNTFSARVIGWRKTYERTTSDPQKLLWDPTILGEFLVTLSSTPVGVVGRAVLNTDLFADTIAITGTTANSGVSVDVVSPANDTAGHLVIDLKGSQKVEVTFTTGGVATSCNGLIALY